MKYSILEEDLVATLFAVKHHYFQIYSLGTLSIIRDHFLSFTSFLNNIHCANPLKFAKSMKIVIFLLLFLQSLVISIPLLHFRTTLGIVCKSKTLERQKIYVICLVSDILVIIYS